jgi:proteasome activator subunit 4
MIHAYQSNLPPHHFDDQGIPFVTTYAAMKARKFVESVLSIELKERLFEGTTVIEEDDDVVDDDEDENPHALDSKETLQAVIRQCLRLQAQFTTVENLKYSGRWTTAELCQMILHLLKLVTCTISDQPTVQLHYETVGYVYHFAQDNREDFAGTAKDSRGLQQELQRPFALPSPAREALLAVMINLLSNKGPLRKVSNLSLYTDDETQSRSLLIVHWKVLLRLLLRTAPYLDEKCHASVPVDASSRQATVLRRTVQLIRSSRHFFDQGLIPGTPLDATAEAVWSMVQTDALFHSHTHACYRASILLYLFHPSRCSAAYYHRVLPLWWECWTNIDRCPEFEFLWLALFCRARKFVHDTYDWTQLRQRLLTNAQYWLQLPIGGTAMDKSFPHVSNPRSRSCPPKLKVFVGASSSYEEGIDFVAKVAKLLIAGLGSGMTDDSNLSAGTHDVLRFLYYVTPYFHPSNLGSWTFTLGAFLHYLCYELCARVGSSVGLQSVARQHPSVAAAYLQLQPNLCQPIPPHEMVLLMHTLLPLCQQAMYSKNGHVGRAGEASMLYLVQLDPDHTIPAFVDFAMRALDISAVNLSHQAPSALSALTRLVHPALRSGTLLMRLPSILRLSLAGIDVNDQNKTLRTLIFYRSLTSWVPVGGSPEQWPTLDGSALCAGTFCMGKDLHMVLETTRKSPEYMKAIANLPESSLMKQGLAAEGEDLHDLVVTEAMSAMSDWALEFLDRVFGLLRASGEREKTAKTTSGVASRHSSADVHTARNYSRVLKETLMQLFAAMDYEVHSIATRTVCNFLQDESHPAAAKDASLLCQAVAAARKDINSHKISSPGLDSLIEVLTDELPRHSTKTLVYRIRCLAGAVRLAGPGVSRHRDRITAAIDFALASPDRHLFKTGCKLLRHTLSTLSESYPISSDCCPRAFSTDEGTRSLGRSAQLNGDMVSWYVPDKMCVDFAHELLKKNVLNRLDVLCSNSGQGVNGERRSALLNMIEVNDVRRCLRVVRYCIRGGASLLLDNDPSENKTDEFVPYEEACHRLLAEATDTIRKSILSIRVRISSFLVVLSAVLACDTFFPDAVQTLPDEVYKKSLPVIASDPKVCKETCLIALLLLTRRGASFRSQEAKTIWKAQKQLAADFLLSAHVDQIGKILQFASLYNDDGAVFYKDGEDAGKTIPRRLLVGRVQLYHDSLQRNASFEVPRRLRRSHRSCSSPRSILFSMKNSLPETLQYLEDLLCLSGNRPLDTYEGIVDGLCALCCHSNTQVRASAVGVMDYAVTRFAWLVASRVPRLLTAISLNDAQLNGKFGFPSCSMLVSKVNNQGKRKRLAEAIKGVCSILALGRSLKQLLATESMRLQLAQTICGTDRLVSLLPAEEVQKIVHYLQVVFSPYRSKIYYLPRVTDADKDAYLKSMSFANDILAEKKVEGTNGDAESVAVHWRKLLLGGWFLLTLVDEDQRSSFVNEQYTRTWDTCFRIVETETAQPLQRVALGLLGRLVSIAGKSHQADARILSEKLSSESFIRAFGQALVFDHREDTSVAGGYDAQWSAGVEDILRDASRNVALKNLFPFQRTSQSMGSFKVSHSQLVESVLAAVNKDMAAEAVKGLLQAAKEMVEAPPNEDQKNQQVTSAEVFAGICGYIVRSPGDNRTQWVSLLLPYLDDVVAKIPFVLSAAYFDALRYALQFANTGSFIVLTEWLVDKILSTLWEPQTGLDLEGIALSITTAGTEGFTIQSKWLYLLSSVLIEMDDSEIDGSLSASSWYSSQLTDLSAMDVDLSATDLENSWDLVIDKLLPKLTSALGHPFDTCRDHIARCLFRICYCHRKQARVDASRSANRLTYFTRTDGPADVTTKQRDPGSIIVDKLASLRSSEGWSFQDRQNALSTARRFISYCVNLGEAKFEYSDYVIPLLPMAFEALRSSIEDDAADLNDTSEENAAKRALEAEVVKVFRFAIAEVSVTSVISYGRNQDFDRVLDAVDAARQHDKWQIRHASANFIRCFQGAHKFLFSEEQSARTMKIVTDLLADDRREVSSAAMAALTGILASMNEADVAVLVDKYAALASKSIIKRAKKGAPKISFESLDEQGKANEMKRARNQQNAVYFLCAAILSQPYETVPFVPVAIAAISKHSFERNAPLGVRDTVKKCCAEYKRTHMSDNWEWQRRVFTQEQLEALEDVVSSPHYYA